MCHIQIQNLMPGVDFTEDQWPVLEVVIPRELEIKIPPDKRQALRGVLSQDPRPGYKRNDTGEHGMVFGKNNIRFAVENGVLRVTAVEEAEKVRRKE